MYPESYTLYADCKELCMIVATGRFHRPFPVPYGESCAQFVATYLAMCYLSTATVFWYVTHIFLIHIMRVSSKADHKLVPGCGTYGNSDIQILIRRNTT